ncbi:MAG: RpiB/LacA/LacB family sugar-phosphate isomerase [Candidatus Colwellbacteria bacterium]|nr:RpiB/LacA/LacB family sugar-phosphate isomerase [Candidatus Colwellbacteria bacterium]
MIIYIGADHRGFNLKGILKNYLKESGYTAVDLGDDRYDENDDYVDFAVKVAKKVGGDPIGGKGVLICGSGVGVDVVANRFPGVRSALAISTDQVLMARKDDDVNILSLAADFTDEDTAKKILSVWLQTPFSGEERYQRRLNKLKELDNSINQLP